MRIIIAILLALILSGCACLTYQTPDGTKVTYTRLFTGSDAIKGTVGSATIESQGQKNLDPAALQLLLDVFKSVK